MCSTLLLTFFLLLLVLLFLLLFMLLLSTMLLLLMLSRHLRNLLRAHRAEVIAPAIADVSGNRRNLFTRELVDPRGHALAPIQDLEDHVLGILEPLVVRQGRTDSPSSVTAVATGAAYVRI